MGWGAIFWPKMPSRDKSGAPGGPFRNFLTVRLVAELPSAFIVAAIVVVMAAAAAAAAMCVRVCILSV